MTLLQLLCKLARLWILRKENAEGEQGEKDACKMGRTFREEEPHKGHVTDARESRQFRRPGLRAITESWAAHAH